jgi:hypothetical protein
MSILPELLHFCSPRHPPAHSQDLRLSDGERVESSSHSALIPPQIKDYGVGIPTCLAKTVQVGTRKVYLQHVSQKAIAWAGRPGGQFVAAVLWLDKTIASAPDTIALMRAKLPEDVKQDLLQDLDLLPGWMASIAKKVCDDSDLAV